MPFEFGGQKTTRMLTTLFDEEEIDPVEDLADLAGIVRFQDNDW